jgi:hypothetical protein
VKSLQFLLFITFIFHYSISNARICYSTGNGNWGNASTWTCAGGPAPGDTIYILAGHTVTVASSVDYHPNPNPMFIVIEGTLHFKNGRKLGLPCNSGVRIIGAGQITAQGYNGNSEYISICNSVVWSADMGPLDSSSPPLGSWFSPLPVTLISFKAQQKNNGVYLTWTTSSEINNEFFTIESSIDGENFKAIKKIRGAGFSNEILNYAYLDDKPYIGINYYRLKQTDYDGNYTYSDIIAVNVKKLENKFSVYPNPIWNSQFTISGLINEEKYTISLCDLSGRIIKTISAEFTNEIIFKVENDITKGYYFVIVQSDIRTEIIKIAVN